MGHADDGAVYQLTEDIALIQTVDFFTPIVDDPYEFGQIAAANSLSDVYAMGGKPRTVLNIVGFPIQTLGPDILAEILRGSDRKSTRLNSSHVAISYAVFCLKKKIINKSNRLFIKHTDDTSRA